MDKQIIPVGYKLTEVGMIPEDWGFLSIGEFCDVTSGGTPNRENKEYWDGDIPWITTALINGGEITYAEQFITEKALVGSATKWIKKGALLIAMYGQGKTRGKVSILGIDATINQACAAIAIKSSVNQIFFLHYLNSQYEEIRDLSNSGGQENLSGAIVKKIKIPVPKLKEQTAIANALSDVDALIAALEKLIDKKTAIKTAAMQQLLTGKKRLPPFDQLNTGYKQTELGEIPKDWEVDTLDNAVIFLDGMRRPVKSGDRERMRGNYRYYGASGIVDYVNDYLFDGEFILLGEDGENILSRNLPLAFKVTGQFWVNNHAHIMQPNSYFNIDYLTAFLESLDYSLLNSGTAQPKLNKQNCLNISVAKPSIKEQTAIADVLSNMDTELNALKQRLAKTQQLKQGMMQELLTGKTRLVTV